MIKLDVEEYCHNCPYFEATNCYAGEEGKIYIYGDDWYIEGGIWELCTENENLKALKKLADKRKG